MKKRNLYIDDPERGCLIGYTPRKYNKFYLDRDDFDIVKNYRWTMLSSGDVVYKDELPQISMQKLIMGPGIYYHKNGNHSDNRKENLIEAKERGLLVSYNGYWAVYKPEHHRAFGNGCVYQHILVAEEMLGRELRDEEVVHHKDQNRKNNSPENLMVFTNDSFHVMYHGGGMLIENEDGTYACKPKENTIIKEVKVNKK